MFSLQSQGRIAEPYGNSMFNIFETAKPISKVAVQFYNTTVNGRKFSFLHILVNTCCFLFCFYLRCFSVYEVVVVCFSLLTYGVEYLKIFDYLYFSFEYLFNPLPIKNIGLFVFLLWDCKCRYVIYKYFLQFCGFASLC